MLWTSQHPNSVFKVYVCVSIETPVCNSRSPSLPPSLSFSLSRSLSFSFAISLISLETPACQSEHEHFKYALTQKKLGQLKRSRNPD